LNTATQGSLAPATDSAAKLLNLFATPAARIPCPFADGVNGPLTDAVRRRVATEVKDLAFKSETVGDLTGWDEPEAHRLTAWVLSMARTLVETVRGQPLHRAVGADSPADVQVIALRSWASIYRGGDHHAAHHHPNTALAAIYYVASAGTCELDLIDPRANVDLFDPGIGFAGEGQQVRLSCRPGELVLIPGWLKHAVPAYDDTDVRISIAWNLSYSFAPEVSLRPAGG
jgi:uncharacterized protein (TIGR02466 family)